MFKSYRIITSKDDLKVLHFEAKAVGKLEVGLSKGNILYAWDEDRDNLRAITIEEAATRLGLTTKQVDQIIMTAGEVVFEEPKPIEPEPAVEDYLLVDEPSPIEAPEPVSEEIIAPVVEEPVTVDDFPFEELEDEPIFASDLAEPEEKPVNEPDMWERIEGIIGELVDEKLAETKEQILDEVKGILDKTIEALVHVRGSLK